MSLITDLQPFGASYQDALRRVDSCWKAQLEVVFGSDEEALVGNGQQPQQTKASETSQFLTTAGERNGFGSTSDAALNDLLGHLGDALPTPNCDLVL